jgi:hypothetical protein
VPTSADSVPENGDQVAAGASAKGRRQKHSPRSMLGTYGPARAWVLTPEGVVVASTASAERRESCPGDDASPEPAQHLVPSATASSGHQNCPASIRDLCDGRLPWGWVRSSEVSCQS